MVFLPVAWFCGLEMHVHLLQATWLHAAHARATSSFLQMGASPQGDNNAAAAAEAAVEPPFVAEAGPAPEGAPQSGGTAGKSTPDAGDASQAPQLQQQPHHHEAGGSAPAADVAEEEEEGEGEEDGDDLDLLSLDNWDDILAGWIGAVGLDAVMAGAGGFPGGPPTPGAAPPPEPAAAAAPAAAPPQPQPRPQQQQQQAAWSQPPLVQHAGGRPFLSVVPDLDARTTDTLPLLGHDPAGAPSFGQAPA